MKTLALYACLIATPVFAQDCGGSFSDFVSALRIEAIKSGANPAKAERFFATVRQDQSVLDADRRQGHFQQDFIEFSGRLISQNRLDNARHYARQYDGLFNRIEAEYGVNRGVLLAFWAFETDFGQIQGDFNTLNALVTLAHDCRRPDLFRPQVFAALELFEKGDFDLETTGAWAGEIGQVQMLPRDILESGRDADGDGHVSLKTSSADALLSGAAMLADLGWRPNEPWLQEVRLPNELDWSLSGIDTALPLADWAQMGITAREGAFFDPSITASLILPLGKDGPAFLAYPNFHVYFEWNQSFTYVLTAAYFATRIEGAARYDPRSPAPGLSGEEMMALQRKLANLGHDVGEIDGILGSGTRAAIQTEQSRLGFPADAWPTPALLGAL